MSESSSSYSELEKKRLADIEERLFHIECALERLIEEYSKESGEVEEDWDELYGEKKEGMDSTEGVSTQPYSWSDS